MATSAATNEATEGLDAAASAVQVIPVYGQIAGAVLALAAQVVQLFSNKHPAGHDTFVALPANGAAAFNNDESDNQTDATTLAINAAYVQAFNAQLSAMKAQGYTFTNPPAIIEIRDDGTPAEFHLNVVPLPNPSRYNLPANALQGAPNWNDRDASQYLNFGQPNDVQGVITNWLNWLQANGYVQAPHPAVAAIASVLPNTAAAVSSVVSSVKSAIAAVFQPAAATAAPATAAAAAPSASAAMLSPVGVEIGAALVIGAIVLVVIFKGRA